jgi:NTP pyrophosphatase (non-canonical NTP hydrolase)
MGNDTSTVLRRRITAKIKPLAGFFSISLGEESDDGVVRLVEQVAESATTAVLRDEWQLAASITDIDVRLEASWPAADKAESLLRRVHGELKEVREAMDDAAVRPELRPHVVEEIGDVMLLLSRLALVYGSKSSLEPLQVVVRKTFARLTAFERLCRSSPDSPRGELWSIAKRTTD